MDPTVEEVYRRDWPLIVGAVARYTSDLNLAEDSVQEAFARALAFKGAIANPAAWITTTARRIAVDALRRRQLEARLLPRLEHETVGSDVAEVAPQQAAFAGDERLLLISLAADPQLNEADRVAVALRFVCGEKSADIARVLLVPETTLAARLTRAKKRIAAGGITGATASSLLPRLEAILTTVYLLFTLGHGDGGARAASRRATAIDLSRELVRLLPSELEAQGLLALLLLTEARRPRISGHDGLGDDAGPVGLEDADRSLWDQRLIAEGMVLAAAALPGGGRFALQAGISGIHDAAPSWEDTDWNAITKLYARLYEVWPAQAVALNSAIARGLSPDVGPEAALAELDRAFPTPQGPLAGQVWAARADLLRRSDRPREAAASYRKALESPLAEQDKRFFQLRLSALAG